MSRTAAAADWQVYRGTGTVIGRFTVRRTARAAAFWALGFGAYVASKAIGYATAYPTLAARNKVAESFSNNVGLRAMLGVPHHIDTVPGGAAWNALGVMIIVGAIWAFLLATKNMRGDEAAGRWEILLAGPTTARQAALNVLAGLSSSLLVFFAVIAVTFIAIGQVHSVSYGVGPALFFALSAVASAVEFMAVGVLASQLMPTRSRAAGLSAGIFGVFYMIRAVADSTGLHWLLNLTPLGWIERLQPLTDSQPLWLLPIAGFAVVCAAVAIYLAGRRDLGDSLFADHDTAEPRTALLNNPLEAAFRLNRSVSLGYLVGIGLMGLFLGLLTKAAAQVFDESAGTQHVIAKLAQQHAASAGTTIFLGVAFLMLLLLVMTYAASTLGALRDDEAEDYLDNLLVRPVSRARLLLERVGLVVVMGTIAALVAGLAVWLGTASQHAGVAPHVLLQASLNMLAPAALTLGIGVLAYGLLPRLTSVIAYGAVAWSFLIDMVSSGLKLNHWILDTSILHHVALAPAASPNWGTAARLALIGLVLAVLGGAAFCRRDLQTE